MNFYAKITVTTGNNRFFPILSGRIRERFPLPMRDVVKLIQNFFKMEEVS